MTTTCTQDEKKEAASAEAPAASPAELEENDTRLVRTLLGGRRSQHALVALKSESPGATPPVDDEQREDATPPNARNVLPRGARPIPDSEGSAGQHSVQRLAAASRNASLVEEFPRRISTAPAGTGVAGNCPMESDDWIGAPDEAHGIESPAAEATGKSPPSGEATGIGFVDTVTGVTISIADLRAALLDG